MVVSVNRILSDNFKKYDTIDQSLVASKNFTRNFGEGDDYIEAHVYTLDNRLIYSDYSFKDYRIPGSLTPGSSSYTTEIEINPGEYLEKLGYTVGTFNVEFNILRKKIFNLNKKYLFIKEISNDRTEIRVASNIISDNDIENGVLNFINEFQSAPYYKDLLLDFGDNKLVNAVNIMLDKNTSPYNILIKLFQPLPDEFQENSSFWVVEEMSESYIYQVELFPEIEQPGIEYLRGPNFDIQFDHKSIPPSDYVNINGLLSNSSISAYQKLLNSLSTKGVQLSIDYSNYSEFVHFSSAKERLLNFVYKLGLIEQYNQSINVLTTTPSASINTSQSIYSYQLSINNIVQNFDGYENYLYYASESNSWPKSGSFPPYSLYSTTSSQAISWLGSDDYNSTYYGGQMESASIYDDENQDNLVHSTPDFIVLDERNYSYQLFLNMIGQHFDNIWVYIEAMTDQYKNTNSVYTGISKDMVYYALRSLGIKLYTATSNDNIFDYIIGVDSSGSYAPVTSSNATLISASNVNLSGQDYYKEVLKRIYHNVTYLLKSKGTERGLKALISTYGIPSTILDVIEYGGSDKSSETIEYSYDRFSYALNSPANSNSYVSTGWELSPMTGRFPDSIEFRFKPYKNINDSYTGSILLEMCPTNGAVTPAFGISLNYTSSNGIPSAKVNFIISGSVTNYVNSSSLVVPMFATGSDGELDWWNFLLKRRFSKSVIQNNDEQYYDLFVKNEIYGKIGHQASCSFHVPVSSSEAFNESWNRTGSLFLGGCAISHRIFSTQCNAYLQEWRLWGEPTQESTFNYHVLNPESYQGNYSSSAYNKLIKRFTLGNNLYTYNHNLTSSVISTHPNQNYPSTASFSGFPTSSYEFFDEIYYTTSPNSVYANPVTDKVRISNSTVSGSVLSPMLKLEEDEVYRTKDIHFIEASFSPQNEINKDIIAHYGNSINLDEIIGDPTNLSLRTYPDLDKLKQDYFLKYIDKYNYNDYIRLIRYFDNSLFKMLGDYVPGRSNLQTGVTIKSHILERNKIQVFQPEVSDLEILDADFGGLNIEGDSNFTSSFEDGSDFYTGELSGSVIDVHDLFDEFNHNPYLQPTSSIDLTMFEKSYFNVLLNNVSASVTSSIHRTKDQYIKGITYPAELQEGYYEYPRHIIPRYVGSKVSSQKYNFYTPGDDTYGKNAAIDHNTWKFAWVNEVNERNLNFYNKCNVNIKYLIDSSSNVIDLSRQNRNLFEVQNIFKSGDRGVLSLMDPLNPTIQSTLEGYKDIFVGGFSFSPILYRELNEALTFDYLNPTQLVEEKVGIKAVQSSSLRYFNPDHAIHEEFTVPATNDANTGYYFYLTPIGSPSENTTGRPFSNQKYNNNNWYYQNNSILKIGYSSGNFFSMVGGSPTYFSADPNPKCCTILEAYTMDYLNFSSTSSALNGYYSEITNDAYEFIPGSPSFYAYKVPRSSNYTINSVIPFSFKANDPESGWTIFKIVGVLEKSSTPNNDSSWEVLATTRMDYYTFPDNGFFGINQDEGAIFVDGDITGNFTGNINITNFTTNLNFNEYVRMRIYFINVRQVWSNADDPNKGGLHDIDFTLGKVGGMPYPEDNHGSFEIFDNQTSLSVPVLSGSIEQIVPIFSLNQTNNSIVFSDSASLFYNTTVFSPQVPSIAENYSDVVYPFTIETGDLFRFGTFQSPSSVYYEVQSVIEPAITPDGIVTRPLEVIFKTDIPLNPSVIETQSFAILRKLPDETNIILNFNKLPGKTSSGVIYNENLEKVIIDKIPQILEPLKDKLLAKVLVVGS